MTSDHKRFRNTNNLRKKENVNKEHKEKIPKMTTSNISNEKAKSGFCDLTEKKVEIIVKKGLNKPFDEINEDIHYNLKEKTYMHDRTRWRIEKQKKIKKDRDIKKKNDMEIHNYPED